MRSICIHMHPCGGDSESTSASWKRICNSGRFWKDRVRLGLDTPCTLGKAKGAADRRRLRRSHRRPLEFALWVNPYGKQASKTSCATNVPQRNTTLVVAQKVFKTRSKSRPWKSRKRLTAQSYPRLKVKLYTLRVPPPGLERDT